MTEQYKCRSYYDDSNVLKDCTCGKCASPEKEPICKDCEGTICGGNGCPDDSEVTPESDESQRESFSPEKEPCEWEESELIAGELWRCIKEDFEKKGVNLPDKWKGVGMAYGGYARAIEIIRQLLTTARQEADQRVAEAVSGELEEVRIYLNRLDGENTLFGYQTAVRDVKRFVEERTRQKTLSAKIK